MVRSSSFAGGQVEPLCRAQLDAQALLRPFCEPNRKQDAVKPAVSRVCESCPE